MRGGVVADGTLMDGGLMDVVLMDGIMAGGTATGAKYLPFLHLSRLLKPSISCDRRVPSTYQSRTSARIERLLEIPDAVDYWPPSRHYA